MSTKILFDFQLQKFWKTEVTGQSGASVQKIAMLKNLQACIDDSGPDELCC